MQEVVAKEEAGSQSLFTCPNCGYVWRPRVYPPNYCAKCNRPLSEGVKKAICERGKRTALRKIVDVEKFKAMWLSGENYARIAEEFGLTSNEIYLATVALNLPRREHGFQLRRYFERMRMENENEVIAFLREKGGYCFYREAVKELPTAAIRRLLFKRQIFKVSFHLKRSSGSYKRKIHRELFKEEFVPKAIRGEGSKTFLCLGRTGVVRLMQAALKRPRDIHVQKTLTAFLRLHLTEAERVAVLWHLGVYGVSPKKRSIRIFGAPVQPTA